MIAKRNGKVIHYGKLESFEWNGDPCALNYLESDKETIKKKLEKQ